MKKSLLVLLMMNQLFCTYSYAFTKAAVRLVNFETRSNAILVRSNEVVAIPHYEIPLELIEMNFAERFSSEMRSHLIFESAGQKYIRWILNPEDTKWHFEVEKYFRTKGLQLQKKYYFKGYRTASRSYLVEDPEKQIQFSVKSSTDNIDGIEVDKKQPIGEAEDSRLNADFLMKIQSHLPFKHIVIMDEPAILKISAIDQAVVFRDLAELNDRSSGKIYVPGFAVLHKKVGTEIALKNGSHDPYEFWTEHYVKAVGRALGELAARTGMQFDSPHSQNFLVELDSNYKPTGRIVFRDLADLYIYADYFRALNVEGDLLLEKFSQKENILDHIAAGFGPLHGTTAPKWVSQAGYVQWKNVFFKAFEDTFADISGLPVTSFKESEGRVYGRYFTNTYTVPQDSSKELRKFWDNIRNTRPPGGIVSCSSLF